MVLADSFYYQPVQIDTINTRVNADLFAKEGDANGRGMVVQITENGIIKDTTGITLRLQWSHISVGVSGFTDFEVVDAAKGLYKLQYPTSMLHRGIVEAFIRITDNSRLSGTRNLLITVERMVGSDETIEAADDFSALQTALTRLSIWEATISGKVDTWEADMEATKQLYIDTLTAAEAGYPQELLSLGSQLADTQADLQAGMGALTADSEVVTARISSVTGKTHTVLDNRIEEIEESVFSKFKNLIGNGDFTDGTTGFTTNNSKIAVIDSRLQVLASAQYGGVDTVPFIASPGHTYYVSAIVDGLVGLTRMFVIGFAEPVISVSAAGGERLSMLFTANAATHKVRFYDNSVSGWANFYVDKVVALDLTAIFGVGNEPSADKLNAWLAYHNDYFDSTLKNKDAELALTNKVFFDTTPATPDVFDHIDTTIYNKDKGLRRWRAALAKVQTSDSIINLNVVGTSISIGGVSTDYQTKGWVYLLKKALQDKYGDAGFGAIPAYYPTEYGPRHWTYTGTWSQQVLFGIMGDAKLSTVIGSTASVPFSGTGIKILVYASSLGGKFLASVDGGTATEFNAYSATAVPCKEFVISGLVDGEHTLVITQNEDTKYTLLIGAVPIKGVKGVRVNNVSKFGGSTGNVTWNNNVLTAEIDYWTPNLTIIEFFTNDYNSQIALATYKANMQTLITRAKLFGDVLLIANGIRTENQTIQQTDYINVMIELATENDVAFFNTFGRWGGNFEYANTTLGFLYDTVHPNDAGHRDIGTFVVKSLIEV